MNNRCLRIAVPAVAVAFAMPVARFAQKRERSVLGLPTLVQFNAVLRSPAQEESNARGFTLVTQETRDTSSKQPIDLRNALNQSANGIVIAPDGVTA